MRDEQLFEQAISLPPAERAQFVAENAVDEAQRVRVMDKVEQYQSIVRASMDDDMPSTLEGSTQVVPGVVIGPYKLRELIGQGGMGVVYVAEQEKPVKRRVALKLIKVGMDTKDVTARFEAERQALAIMDHPHIARVLDAGSTEAGRPYFVMELVRGIPITDYCDEQKLTIRERLALFMDVCKAIQHAHQKGIIHRDIKPSNVLVTEHDGVPVPKVIDFGVAKAIGQPLSDHSVYTHHLQPVGTLLYMSPEQSRLSGLDIDTRSDVYSLGLLLYELLTGSLPFDKETFNRATFDEKRRIIAEDEAPKPSTRISKHGTTSTKVSQSRRANIAVLQSQLRGELDWILIKSLEKDRSRRYNSPIDMAADIDRYLRGDTVEACPPSAWYQFSKFYRRNRASVATTAAVFVALLMGLVVALYFFKREEQLRETREQQLYISDMVAAHAYLEQNNVKQTVKILAQYAPGKPATHRRRWEWDYLWGRCLRALEAPRLVQTDGDCPLAVDFSPNGQLLAIAKPSQVILFDRVATEWRPRPPIQRHGWHGTFVRFSPDGRYLAYQKTMTGELTILEHLTGIEVTLDASTPFRFSPDGRYFIALHSNKMIVADFQQSLKGTLAIHAEFDYPRQPVLGDGQWNENTVDISDLGNFVAIGFDQQLSIWRWKEDGEVFEVIQEIPFLVDRVSAVCFLKGDEQLVVGDRAGNIFVADRQQGKITKVLQQHRDEIRAVDYSATRNQFVVASRDNSISVWDATTFRLVEVIQGHSGICQDVAFSPDGSLIASASQDYSVGLWTINELQSARATVPLGALRFDTKVKGFENALFYQHDDTLRSHALVESAQAEISIAESVSVFDVTEDGLLVFGGIDGRAELHDLRLAESRIAWEAHPAQLNLVAAHRQGDLTYVATADTSGTLKLWKVQIGVAKLCQEFNRVLGVWPRQRNEINLPAAFSKDGKALFAADQQNAVCVFDVSSNKLQCKLPGHGDTVLDIAVSDDSQRFATGSFDNTVRLWTRLADGNYSSMLLEGHSASVRGVRFLSDGATLVSGAGDGTLKFWDLHMKPHRERMTLLIGDIVNSVSLLRRDEILIGKSRNQFEILSLPSEERILQSLTLVDSYLNSNTR